MAAERSDLDLLAVLRAALTASTLDLLRPLHQRVAEEHPTWASRVEVEYLYVQALTDFRTCPRPMVRISPGEPLHLVAATRPHLLNWYTARLQGLPLWGPAPTEIIPEITQAEFRAVVVEHAANRPRWVQDMRGPGAQAYAVLTLCRGRGWRLTTWLLLTGAVFVEFVVTFVACGYVYLLYAGGLQ